MVHALSEVGRVLVPGGLLIDLRPLAEQWPIEVAWIGGYEQVGRATDLPESLPIDVAANAAMDALANSWGFRRERVELFPLFYYWDTPKAMREYITEEWNDVITVEDSVWSNLGARWASASADARVRVRLKMLISRYRKEN